MKCEKCKREFEGASWQRLCKRCYMVEKNSTNTKEAETLNIQDTNKIIVRQVLYKVAAELLEKGTPATKVNQFVRELEQGFYL